MSNPRGKGARGLPRGGRAHVSHVDDSDNTPADGDLSEAILANVGSTAPSFAASSRSGAPK